MRPILVLVLLMVSITAISSANSKVGDGKAVGGNNDFELRKVEARKNFATNRRLKLLKRQRNLREKLEKAKSDTAKDEISKKLKVVKSKLKKIRKRGRKTPSLFKDLTRKNRLEKKKVEGVSMDQNKAATQQEIAKKETPDKKVFALNLELKLPQSTFVKSLEEAKIAQTNETFEPSLVRAYNESVKVNHFQPPVDLCKLKRCPQMCKEGRCSCFMGFHLTKDSKRCVDINECFINNGNCAEKCVNKNGYHYCACRRGFKLSRDSRTCIDIDECLLNNGHGLCEDTCINTEGSFRCACNRPGTTLSSDLMRCDDIDECADGSWGCSHGCINVNRGGAVCTCPDGLILSPDMKNCEGKTEINVNRGGAVCTCTDGLILSPDMKNCEDINECLIIQNQTCPNCINTVGSYLCLEQGVTDKTCPALPSPRVGFFDCNREQSLKSSIKWISDRELRLYTPGTVCSLNCPEESKRKEIVCGVDGKWIGEENGNC